MSNNCSSDIPSNFKSTLPPRKRAKTKEEKEQRRIERILRNRRAAHQSREKKRLHLVFLEKKCNLLERIIDKIGVERDQDTELKQLYDEYQSMVSEYGSFAGSCSRRESPSPSPSKEEAFSPTSTPTSLEDSPLSHTTVESPQVKQEFAFDYVLEDSNASSFPTVKQESDTPNNWNLLLTANQHDVSNDESNNSASMAMTDSSLDLDYWRNPAVITAHHLFFKKLHL